MHQTIDDPHISPRARPKHLAFTLALAAAAELEEGRVEQRR